MSLEARLEDMIVEHLAGYADVKVDITRERQGPDLIEEARKLGGLIAVCHTTGRPEGDSEKANEYEMRLNFEIYIMTVSRRTKKGSLTQMDKVRKAMHELEYLNSNFIYDGHDINPTKTEEGVYMAEIDYSIKLFFPSAFIED